MTALYLDGFPETSSIDEVFAFSQSAKDLLYENQTYFGTLLPASETETFRMATWHLAGPQWFG